MNTAVTISYAKQALVLIALERRDGAWVPLKTIEQETGMNAEDVRNVCGFMHCIGMVEEGISDEGPCIRDPYAHVKYTPTVSLDKSAAPSGFTPPTTF